jgi:deazaflavin-dependent oxidoreductase (nitroreductase family)
MTEYVVTSCQRRSVRRSCDTHSDIGPPLHGNRAPPPPGCRGPRTKGQTVSDWNANVIEEFRANDGKVGGFFEDKDVLILHTTGARSGLEGLTPLVYRQEGDRVFIFASKGGSDSHPDWYHNLKANPIVSVEIGADTSSATAREVGGDERDAVYARQAADIENFLTYQAGTQRTIPVIELTIA